MAQIKVEVSDKFIGEATRKEIKSLKGQVIRSTNKIVKLERQVRENQELVDRARRIVEATRDAGRFPEDDDC